MRYRHCQECNALHDADTWPHAIEAEPKYDPSQNYDEYLSGPRAGTFRLCKICGDLHDVYDWPDNHRDEPPPRSELAAPFLISDNLESLGGLNGVQNQADGKFYTSKAKLRSDYKARGMVEMGNDKPAPPSKPKPDRKKIKEAVAKAWNVVHNEGGSVANFRARSKVQTPFGVVAK